MPLIASISGVRGVFGDGLDPDTLVEYAAAFGVWLRRRTAGSQPPTVVVGRDARVTGDLCSRIVTATLQAVGCDVIDAGLAATPTVEIGILETHADGGIVLSASHNDAEWNALKLFNELGEYLTDAQGREVHSIREEDRKPWRMWDGIGSLQANDFLESHVARIVALPMVDPRRIGAKPPRVVIDAVNSVGGIALVHLLTRLGVPEEYIDCLHCEPSGVFAHKAEPLPAHLGEIAQVVKDTGADLGLAVDPDVDRLALIADGGEIIGEELTQVVAADFLFSRRPGPFVTNLSSSRLIEDIAARYGQEVHRSAVGEINVVTKMKEVDAVLGGEGNGGVIFPAVHYGRDALVGAALVLQYLAASGKSLSAIVQDYPTYFLRKEKISLEGVDAEAVLKRVSERYAGERISTVDGLKIDFDEGWVHLRKSNTEPIIRVYAEGSSEEKADALAQRFLAELQDRS